MEFSVLSKSVARLVSFDTSTEAGRSGERYRRALLTMAASSAAKCMTVLVTLVSVPLSVSYLGAERYGLWAIISSVAVMLTFSDFGIGNGLLNAVSSGAGRDEAGTVRDYVSSAFYMLMAVACVFGIGFAVLYTQVSWESFFNVSTSTAVAEAGPSLAAFVACVLVSMPLGVVYRVQLGLQEGFVSSLWLGLGALLGLVGLLAAVRLGAGLPWLVVAMAGAPALTALANSVYVFCFQRPSLRPTHHNVTRDASRRLLGSGLLFFALQVVAAATTSADGLIAAQLLGAHAVTEYWVPAKMFAVVPLLVGTMVLSLWPAYGESISRGDQAWALGALRRSVLVVFVSTSVFASALVMFGSDLLALWVKGAANPSAELLVGLALYTVVGTVVNAVAMFLNGANILKFQLLCAVLVMVGSVAAKIVLVRTIGVAGLAWGAALGYAVFAGIPYALYFPRITSTLARAQVGHPSQGRSGPARPVGA